MKFKYSGVSALQEFLVEQGKGPCFLGEQLSAADAAAPFPQRFKVVLEDGIDCYKANEGRASQWPASGWKFSRSAAHLDTILSREIVKKTFPEVMGPFLMCAIIESGCFVSSEAFR